MSSNLDEYLTKLMVPYIPIINSNTTLQDEYNNLKSSAQNFPSSKMKLKKNHTNEPKFFQFEHNIDEIFSQKMVQFLFSFIPIFLQTKLPNDVSPNIEFDYLFNTERTRGNCESGQFHADKNEKEVNLEDDRIEHKNQHKNQRNISAPKTSTPFSIMQFNMLADHLSGTHPSFGNFEGVDVKCLDMVSYRQWKLLYSILERHFFICPKSTNFIETGEEPNDNDKTPPPTITPMVSTYLDNNTVINDVICVEEMDQMYYLRFFGPIMALCGHNSCFSPKQLPNSSFGGLDESKDDEYIADGTSIFTRHELLTTKMFFLSKKYNDENDDANDDENDDENTEKIPDFLKKHFAQIAVSVLIKIKSQYILVFATHLKADKTEEGERIREMQVKELFRAVDDQVNCIIEGYEIGEKSEGGRRRYNLSVVVCGDFNAAPYIGKTTPYKPCTYQYSTMEAKIELFSKNVDKNDENLQKEKISATFFESVYSHYNSYYNSYMSRNNRNISDTDRFYKIEPPAVRTKEDICGMDNILNKTGHKIVDLFHNFFDQKYEKNNNIQPGLYQEAPYTTIKTRSSTLFKHCIDYIFYNRSSNGRCIDKSIDEKNIEKNIEQNNDEKNGTKSDKLIELYEMKLIGIGTLPNTSILPKCGLPDWSFGSDHLPLFALFDLE
jgi:mRNA deadenylase 3'-5' endonuclease subunit Ccr4